MIYSQRNSVVRLLPDSVDYPEAVLPIQGIRIKAVDFDPVAHYLYWVFILHAALEFIDLCYVETIFRLMAKPIR